MHSLQDLEVPTVRTDCYFIDSATLQESHPPMDVQTHSELMHSSQYYVSAQKNPAPGTPETPQTYTLLFEVWALQIWNTPIVINTIIIVFIKRFW